MGRSRDIVQIKEKYAHMETSGEKDFTKHRKATFCCSKIFLSQSFSKNKSLSSATSALST